MHRPSRPSPTAAASRRGSPVRLYSARWTRDAGCLRRPSTPEAYPPSGSSGPAHPAPPLHIPAGTHEKNPDVVIKLAVREANGSWCEPFTVAAVRTAAGEPVAHWNPVLFTHDDSITLCESVLQTNPSNHSQVLAP
jgi:hypothetical protein